MSAIFTEQWYREQMAKRAPKSEPSQAYDGPESDVHEQIESYCKQRRWYYVHSRMDKRTTQAKGVTDFIIATDDGVTMWVEVKRKSSKPTPEQIGTKVWLEMLGHRSSIVYSFEEFLEEVTTKLRHSRRR